MVNRDKSGLIFSKFVQKPKERELKSVMQMKKLKEDTVYLGAPLFLTNNRSRDFKFLRDKLEARLKGWRSKNLSWAGRITMIKSVAQALYPLIQCQLLSYQRRSVTTSMPKCADFGGIQNPKGEDM